MLDGLKITDLKSTIVIEVIEVRTDSTDSGLSLHR